MLWVVKRPISFLLSAQNERLKIIKKKKYTIFLHTR